MKSKIFIFALYLIVFSSCKSNKETDKLKDIAEVENKQTNQEGYNLLKNNCYACHSVTAKSHDNIIAPPMTAVKRRYLIPYSTKEKFTKRMIEWVLNPIEENALMRGAVKQFKVMPKQPFDEDVIVKIVEYIYDNDLEKPQWFDSHFEEEHPEGMANGQGGGRGGGNGMGNRKNKN